MGLSFTSFAGMLLGFGLAVWFGTVTKQSLIAYRIGSENISRREPLFYGFFFFVTLGVLFALLESGLPGIVLVLGMLGVAVAEEAISKRIFERASTGTYYVSIRDVRN